jgi:hypothetical protein
MVTIYDGELVAFWLCFDECSSSSLDDAYEFMDCVKLCMRDYVFHKQGCLHC